MSLTLNGAFWPTISPLFHGSRQAAFTLDPMMDSYQVEGHRRCSFERIKALVTGQNGRGSTTSDSRMVGAWSDQLSGRKSASRLGCELTVPAKSRRSSTTAFRHSSTASTGRSCVQPLARGRRRPRVLNVLQRGLAWRADVSVSLRTSTAMRYSPAAGKDAGGCGVARPKSC
jgi:hypothetical protein